MSSRWFVRSAVFDTSSTQYQSLSKYDDKLQEKLRNLSILNHLPLLTWFEKGLLILDYFQIFALQWVMAQPWPWPYLWSYYTRPLVYINFDHFSMTENGALAGRSSSLRSEWGEMDNYPIYALSFAIPQFVLFVCILLFRKEFDFYGRMMTKPSHYFVGIALLLSYILYLPASLAVFRLYYCEDTDTKDDVLAADPSVNCFDTEHTTFFIICSCLSLPVFFGLPYIMYNYISTSMVYQYSLDHEKRIQIWEVLQMLELDDYWTKEQLWLTSSFTKYGSFFRFHLTVLKSWLLVVFMFFRFNFKVQSFVNCASIVLFCLYYTFGFDVLPYRSRSSNIMLFIAFAMMLVNSFFAMANAFQVQNAMTVASTESYFLGLFSFISFMIMAAILLYTNLRASIEGNIDWPSHRTLSRIWHNSELLPKIAKWVETLRESFIVKADFLMAPVEVADINNLEESIRRLRGCWLAARAIGSLFEVPLSEQLEEMMYIHATRLPDALRKHDYWDDMCKDEDAMGTLHARYDRHQ